MLELIKELVVTCLLKDYRKVSATDFITTSIDHISATAQSSNIETIDDSCIVNVKSKTATVSFTGIGDTGQMQPHTSAEQLQQKSTELSMAIQEPTAAAKMTTTTTTTTQMQKEMEAKTETAQASLTLALAKPTIQATTNDVEMQSLPKNCVLQNVLHLQLLAKRNLRAMFAAGYAQKTGTSYNTLYALCQKCNDKTLSIAKLTHAEEYLLGATALDCSIMLTFQEVPISNNDICSSAYSHIVSLPAHDKCFLTKATLLDLDPKPDSHFAKYLKQTKAAYECCQVLKEN